jgi:uncharacterized membrane protein YvlD (DUF360 family)
LAHGFYVAGFGSALWASILYSLINFGINILIRSENETIIFTEKHVTHYK